MTTDHLFAYIQRIAFLEAQRDEAMKQSNRDLQARREADARAHEALEAKEASEVFGPAVAAHRRANQIVLDKIREALVAGMPGYDTATPMHEAVGQLVDRVIAAEHEHDLLRKKAIDSEESLVQVRSSAQRRIANLEERIVAERKDSNDVVKYQFEMTARCKNLENALYNVNKERDALSATLTKVSDDYNDAAFRNRAAYVEIERLRKNNQNLQDELDVRDRAISALKIDHGTTEQHLVANISARDAGEIALRQAHSDLAEKYKATKSELDDHCFEVKRLTKNNDLLRADLDSYKKAHEILSKNHVEVEARLASLVAGTDDHLSEIKHLTKRNDFLQAEVNNLRDPGPDVPGYLVDRRFSRWESPETRILRAERDRYKEWHLQSVDRLKETQAVIEIFMARGPCSGDFPDGFNERCQKALRKDFWHA